MPFVTIDGVKYCQNRLHLLTPEHVFASGVFKGQCRTCRLAGRRRRRARNAAPKPETCPNGHPLSARRPGRSDCAICHREAAVRRARLRGAKPAVRLTRQQKLEQRRKWQAKRNALKRAAFVETVNPSVVYERDAGICGICREPVPRDAYEIDHIMPLSRRGEHSYANTQVAHKHCNRRKWASLPLELRTAYA